MPADPTVEAKLAATQHALLSIAQALRELVLSADPKINEEWKWNAPSFTYADEDRLTMNLSAKDRVRLIFHRGAKKTKSVAFKDESGLLKWLGPDRAFVEFQSRDQLKGSAAALQKLIAAWVKA